VPGPGKGPRRVKLFSNTWPHLITINCYPLPKDLAVESKKGGQTYGDRGQDHVIGNKVAAMIEPTIYPPIWLSKILIVYLGVILAVALLLIVLDFCGKGVLRKDVLDFVKRAVLLLVFGLSVGEGFKMLIKALISLFLIRS
jgi:hypothetical protein